MADSTPSVVAFQAPPNYICTSNIEYAFCAPKASGDYYIAIPKNYPAQQDITKIHSWFENLNAFPTFIPHTPPEFNASNNYNYRFYNVTSLLPLFIQNKNGTRDDVVGPNCFQTVLASSGYNSLWGRHVSPDEFKYYLKRDYIPVYCKKAKFGALIVYDTSSLMYDAGDHAAFHILGGIVFQKGGWENYYPYENTTIENAMNTLGSHWRPPPEDRFLNPTWPGANMKWVHVCYEKRHQSIERETSSTPQDRNWFLPLFQYYINRLKRVSNFTWSTFKQNRIDLLTIENMWKILSDFRDRIGNVNPTDVLLKIDDNIAESYLELDSLSWQYQAMVDTYYPIKTKWHLEDLYRERYVNFNEDFYEELRLYLKLLNAPKENWDKIIAKVESEIKKYDPVSLAGTGERIPYFSILQKAIAACQSTSCISEGASSYEFTEYGIVWNFLRQNWYYEGKEA